MPHYLLKNSRLLDIPSIMPPSDRFVLCLTKGKILLLLLGKYLILCDITPSTTSASLSRSSVSATPKAPKPHAHARTHTRYSHVHASVN